MLFRSPWCLHLSYIKPHWPFKAPAPYHDLFGPEDCRAPVRSPAERSDPHPVHAAYQRLEESVTFASDTVWRAIRPVYMGLVKQIDDSLGDLFAYLEANGLMDTTMIVFTSDHGDYLGDHWMGEKDLFHEPSVKIPLIASAVAPSSGRLTAMMPPNAETSSHFSAAS